jgi:hypothetical protein
VVQVLEHVDDLAVMRAQWGRTDLVCLVGHHSGLLRVVMHGWVFVRSQRVWVRQRRM